MRESKGHERETCKVSSTPTTKGPLKRGGAKRHSRREDHAPVHWARGISETQSSDLLQIAVAVVGSGLAIRCLLHLSYLHATMQVLSISGHGPLIKDLEHRVHATGPGGRMAKLLRSTD